LNIVCSSLCFASAILIQSRSLRIFSQFDFCQYDNTKDACNCYIKAQGTEEEELQSLQTGE
jgi:hypothetical protein